jgi:hypothetical protein
VTARPLRPTRVVYGLYPIHETLCFLEEGHARALDAEVSAVKACTTVEQARKLAPTLQHTLFPGIEDLEEHDGDPGAPWDWTEQGAVQDGDWPPMPDALSLEVFEEADAEAWNEIFSDSVGGLIGDTTFNGDYLYVPRRNEAALLAAFDRLGISYVRDDALLDNLGMDL